MMHPGVFLKGEINHHKLSISYVANYLGYSRSQLHRVLRGECAISRRMAIALEGKYGGDRDWWLGQQKKYDEFVFASKVKELK